MKYKVVALIGGAGSGKDTILQELIKKDNTINKMVSFTTRPPRDGEIDGVQYHFVDSETFAQMILDDKMLEASAFNDWVYGTALDSLVLDKVNVGIFNPEGIDSLMNHKDKIELYVYYVSVPDKERIIRQLRREEDPDIEEIFRRYHADFQDFFDLDFHHNEIPNTTKKDLKDSVKIILSTIKKLQVKIKHGI